MDGRKRSVIQRILPACIAATLLFCGAPLVFADTALPEGTAAGLPEKLTVMDSDGASVSSDTGAYFFYVEDMLMGETYSKDIQIMNLREDEAYHIYLYAEPIGSEGEIDLEEECTAVFLLNGEQVYEGKVTGEGDPDMRETPIDLGLYEPGGAGTLTCRITWNGGDTGGLIDYGSRVVDADGVTVIRGESGDAYISGTVTFRWIFYAVVDEEYVPPKTGVLAGSLWMELAALAVVGALSLILLVLILKKRRDNRKQGETAEITKPPRRTKQ